MRSLKNLGQAPAALPVLADDVLEFHAARLLLLLSVCGTAGRINGLTKMAKLDFFVRYPEFFDQVQEQDGAHLGAAPRLPRESSMIRFHYGPWDPRYYHILAYLEGKGLITVRQQASTYVFALTSLGKTVTASLQRTPVFARIVAHMAAVKKALGGKAGSTLKDLVYKLFAEEVAEKRLGEVIQ